MSVRELAESPALVGRDDLLALAARRLDEAAAGKGELLLLAGEAGIGKTRLLAAISAHANRSGFAVIRASAFRGDAEISGALLLDLASDLRGDESSTSRAVRAAIPSRIRQPASEPDPQRARRQLVRDLADRFSELDRECRLLLVLEDLHWADDLSLEVFEHVATHLATRATLVVAAYRSDELYPHSAIREWRHRLVSQRLAEEVRLRRLTIEQTATLTSSILGHPAPVHLVAAIFDRSDGIPLHVEELIAAAKDSESNELERFSVPDTLSDAVLARAATLDPATRDLAATAAVIGRRFEFDVLTAIADQPENDVARCLEELQSAHLVVGRPEADAFDFRHALIRDALYAAVPLPRRRELHHRVATVATGRVYDDAFVSLHFDQANRPSEAYTHARRAADRATSVSAHREALELYRRALRNLPADLDVASHAQLLAALGRAAAAVDDNETAADAFGRAHALWAGAGDRLSAAAIVPPLVAARHLLGDDLESRATQIEAALETLRGRPACKEQAQLLGALSAAYMLSRRLDESIEYGERCVACADVTDDEPTRINANATLGSDFLFAGRMDEGWSRLEGAVSRARAIRHEAEAARTYRMLSTSASVLVEYDRAKTWLAKGISWAEKAELWNHRNYMSAHLAHVQWAVGEWSQAVDTADHALADGRGGITTRVTAQYVLGYLAMGRADWPRATQLLTSSLADGESMSELQRISPPLWGLAETAFLRGDCASARALCDRGFALSAAVDDAAYLFPFLVTGTRARLATQDGEDAKRWFKLVAEALTRRRIPGTLPAITHAEALLKLAEGEVGAARAGFTAARRAWNELHRYWEGSWAALDEARSLVSQNLVADARSLTDPVTRLANETGAQAILDAVSDLFDAGTTSPVEPWHPLTAREYEVATLVASGLTNREIAAKLVLAPKTVSAHVEHILAKLRAARRAEIAAWATRVKEDRRLSQ